MGYEKERAGVKWQALRSRLSGMSIAGLGGLSWKSEESERKVVRDVLIALEDKRALYTRAAWEEPAHVVSSIKSMRDLFTGGLQRLGDDSPARDPFTRMRIHCANFMTLRSTNEFVQGVGMMSERDTSMWEQEEFFVSLGLLRSAFGYEIAFLGYVYQIGIEPALAAILPAEAK